VRAHGDPRAHPQLDEMLDRMVANGLLDEVDVVLLERRQHPDSLTQGPAAVRVEAQPRLGAEELAGRGDGREIVRVFEPDLEVEDVEAGGEAVGDLRGQLLPRAAGEVVEVGRLLLPKPAEEPPERLFPGAAAEIPER